MKVIVIGAGVAGLTCAVELALRGCAVEVFERAASLGHNCSWYAGGMLAPWCELESAEPLIARLGEQSIKWWREHLPDTVSNGSLVVAHGRDSGELMRFAKRTTHYQWLNAAAIDALEPDLAGRFQTALWFEDEAHLDPRMALTHLSELLLRLGGRLHFNTPLAAAIHSDQAIVDCTGLAARTTLADLRGVKGEMLLLRSTELTLQRPVRVLHPRIPLYIVPRGDGVFMVGATMIESDDARRITTRSMLELLSAAYALHPAFGESEIIEVGTQVRPAFTDNQPRIRRRGNLLQVNGLYRHGFLVAPALAQYVANILLHDQHYPEVMDEYPGQRQTA
jgi:glycine oxidase